jgi:arylsulfatase A-like enzyme
MSREPAPWMLSMHFTAPHWPWEGPGDEKLSADVSNALHFDGGNIATYRAMVESLDRNVARLLAALDASGQRDNTLVIFTSDNGGERFSKTWPYNGLKGELLEGGIRVPLLVRWPGKVPAGAVTGQAAITMDWVPTWMELAGLPAGERMPVDGASLLPALLEGRAQERSLFWRYKGAGGQAAVRRGRWKYLRINGGEFLFDVDADPQERGNLKDKHADVFAALRAEWDAWNAQMIPYPPESATWDNRSQKTLADRY